MYSTCLFCHAPLGANESIEHFPIGRKLAFDAARGRLWAVCPACHQWNLSPLEERWEAIEEAERLYRATRLRVATDQIGLARLRDGTDLVRIGEPLRPEFAAWRYGERFAARYRRNIAWVAAGSAMMVGYVVAGPVMGLIAGGAGALPLNAYQMASAYVRRRRIVARVVSADGTFAVTDQHLAEAKFIATSAGDDWGLVLPHTGRDEPVGRFVRPLRSGAMGGLAPTTTVRGEAALAASRAILPRINRSGGPRSAIAEAVRVLEDAGSPEELFRRATRRTGRDAAGDPSRTIASLGREFVLGLEMAAHEETERRALEGELALLEAAWREAEEVAAIADELTLPARVFERLERLRG